MRLFLPTAVLGLVIGSIGCDSKSTDANKPMDPPKGESAGHDHPSTGPHGGDIIELGDEEYHAEFLHDEKSDDVTIFILDGTAKNTAPIEALEVVINLKHDGKPEQHKLAAAPFDGETGGRSSRFVSKANHDLSHAIQEEGSDARLNVTISDKTYSGKIEHDHDDDGHDHKDETK